MFQSRAILQTICSALIVCAVGVGCRFWKSETETASTETWENVFGTAGPQVVDASRSTLDTVILEVAHIEQPLSDISMIDLLWKEVDQIGALDAQTRSKLEENGIRVGITGPNLPRTLQKLLEVDAAWREERTDGSRGTTAQTVTIFPGQPTHMMTSDSYANCEIEIPKLSGPEKVKFQHASCVFRMDADTLQEGWVELQFLPEIHHDAQSLRRVATDDGWQIRSSQKVEPIYDQKFSLTLNKGEVVVMTATEPRPGSLGHAMFIGDGEDDHIQRLIVVRLTELRTARARSNREEQ